MNNDLTNKQRGFYYAIYTCLNCGKTMEREIKFGSSIPVLSANIADNTIMKQYLTPAPECEFCGCYHWSHGKV